MASFKDQVEDLTGVTISDTDGLDAMLQGSAREICKILPEDERVKMATITNDVTSTVDKEIFSVSRSGYYATEIGRGLAAQAADTNSIHSATNETPVYYVADKALTVLPSSGTVQILSFTAPAVANTWGTSELIGAGLPSSIEYAITLGAAMGQLHALLAVKRVAMLSGLSMSSVAPSVPTLSAQSVDDFSSAAPTYVKPIKVTSTAFTDYTSGLSEADPGIFSIGSVAPASPSLTQVTFTSVDTALDIVTPVVATATLAAATIYTGSAPNFTKPFAGPDFAQVNTYIDTDEDTELANAKILEINSQLSQYQSDIQNEQAEFNKEHAIYQAAIQDSSQTLQIANGVNLAQAQSDLAVATSNKDRDLQRQLQNNVNTMQAIINDNNRKIALYQSEIQTYQANVSKEVQVYSSKMSQYQLELTSAIQTWGKTEEDNISTYQTDIQNELNKFNKESAIYQATMQEKVQEAQLKDSNEGRKLQQYQAELQAYQNNVAKEVQEYTTKIQRQQMEMDTLKTQYAWVGGQYQQQLQILAGMPRQGVPTQND